MAADVAEAKEVAKANGEEIHRLHLCMEKQHGERLALESVRQTEQKLSERRTALNMWAVGVLIAIAAIVVPIVRDIWK